MSRNPNDAPLPVERFERSTTETVEMTEVDGMEQGAVLRFTDVGRSGQPSADREVHTCYGDLYVIVNALRDYANILEGVLQEWSLTEFHRAAYGLHADRCRKIAGKYADAIGYDYDKALEQCRQKRSKGNGGEETGMDGLEAAIGNGKTKKKKREGKKANGRKKRT